LALPSSQITLVNTWPGLRLRWRLEYLPIAYSRLLPSACCKASAFSANVPTDYPYVHNYTFFGAQYRPCIFEMSQLRTSITGFAREHLYCPVG
jgi:hypothetical protein